jgi:nucleoside-diphosphate-sugar epimerase/predicted dehydrogenase
VVAPFHVLVLGAGAVVSEYYIPALRMLGWERGATIVDSAPSALASLKAACVEASVQQLDFRAALSDSSIIHNVEAAVVALPNSLHEEAALLCLERGLHVLCEKPLARTADGCRRLAHAAKQSHRILAVGMVRRLLPSLSMLREALRLQLIGELIEIDVEDGEPYAWLSESGSFFRIENGGVLADMGVHYLDFIQELAGDLVPLSYADDFKGGVEANLVFHLKTLSGVPVRLTLSRTRKLRNTLLCRGQRGELRAEKQTFDSCLWHSYDTGAVTRLAPEKPFGSFSWPPTLQSCFARQLLDFKNCIRDGSAPSVSATSAVATTGLIEWAYAQRDSRLSTRHVSTDGGDGRLPVGTVLVTGATGFIGTHLIERLFEGAGRQVVAPVRNYRTCAGIARFPVQMPRLDLLNYEKVKSAVAGARFVFHLAYGRDGRQAERVTVDGTRNVVEAAIATGSEAVVVLSTIYVFGQPDGRVDETWPYHPTGGEYGLSKAKMERWCLTRAKSSPATRIVILCPSCVYGPGGHTYSAMPMRMAGEANFCWIDSGCGVANYTFVDNLVDAMLLAATSIEAHGRRFIINDGYTTWRTFLEQLLGEQAASVPSYSRRQLRDLQRRHPRPSVLDLVHLMVSDQRLRSAARQTMLVDAALRAADRVAPQLLDRLKQTQRVSPTIQHPELASTTPPEWLADLFGPAQTVFVSKKAHEVLGWTAHVPLEEGMRATTAWLCTNHLE